MIIGRNLNGTIYGAWTSEQPNDADHPRMEEVADDHPDVVEFFSPKAVAADPINDLRIAMKADPLLLNKLRALP